MYGFCRSGCTTTYMCKVETDLFYLCSSPSLLRLFFIVSQVNLSKSGKVRGCEMTHINNRKLLPN